MAIQLRNTSDVHENGVKMVVYGAAGVGKTALIPTLPNPVALSAESGLLTIKDANIPYIDIRSLDDLTEAYTWLTQSAEARGFDSVAIDSWSEIAEVALASFKKTVKDPRQAYGELGDKMSEMIRAFRDIEGRNVYISSKMEKTTDDMGRIMYAPMMPGQKVGQALPYFFDLVMPLRIEKDADGQAHRVLMTDSDGLWTAKARGFALDQWEAPDLGAIINKIRGIV